MEAAGTSIVRQKGLQPFIFHLAGGLAAALFDWKRANWCNAIAGRAQSLNRALSARTQWAHNAGCNHRDSGWHHLIRPLSIFVLIPRW
jgi:hypothetical protein